MLALSSLSLLSNSRWNMASCLTLPQHSFPDRKNCIQSEWEPKETLPHLVASYRLFGHNKQVTTTDGKDSMCSVLGTKAQRQLG